MQTPYEIKKGLEVCSKHSETTAACKQCPYINVDDGCHEVMREGLEYINQLEQRLASVGKTCPEWISVEERLPKNGQIVFCYTKYFYEVLQWDDDSEQWCGQNSVNEKHYVTHWMPIPEPPLEII